MTAQPPVSQHAPDLLAVRLALDIAETARAKQLADLPATPLDPVAALHRESVERVLAEIRAALQRLDQGCYGRCTACGQDVPTARLELRPWAATCTRCGQR